jgi:uncharacterized protein YecA (UPF0149 family)
MLDTGKYENKVENVAESADVSTAFMKRAKQTARRTTPRELSKKNWLPS